jgi:DNA-binding XRE family transcriptional regulator
VAREPADIADQRRALGERLAAFRQAAELTQGELARRVFRHRTTLVHVEKGRRPGDAQFWTAVDAAVGAKGALLAAFCEVGASKTAHEQRIRAAQLVEARRRAASGREPRAAWLPVPEAENCLAEQPVWAVADESTRFLAWAEPENVGELTLEQLHSELRRISHAYLKAPTGPLFARTREVRNRAFTLLAGRQRPRHSRDLYAAAGWSLTLLAWMSVDLDWPDAAEAHARAAWLCAERAEHDGLRAWVRATQHTAARWQHDFATAARYAADGLHYPAGGSAELFLLGARALDLAHCGRVREADAAFKRALHAAEVVDLTGDDLAGPFTCSVDRAGGFLSDAELALGRPADALAIADRAVAAFESTPDDRRNLGSERMVRLRQVQAHLMLGRLDGAEEALRPVLAIAPQHRVRPLLFLLSEVDAIASAPAFDNEPVVSTIREAIVDFRRGTAIKELNASEQETKP